MGALGVSARPKLVQPEGFASSARADLAIAIAAAGADADKARELQKVLSGLAAAAEAARAVVADATAAVEAAKRAAVSHTLARAAGAPGVTPPGVKEARARLVDAQDDLDTAEAAAVAQKQRVAEAGAASPQAAAKIKAAALEVLRSDPAITGLLEEVHRAQRELISKCRLLEWAIKVGALPGRDAPSEISSDHPHYRLLRARIFAMMIPMNHVEGSTFGRIDVNQRLHNPSPLWDAALAALERDADAPLPADPSSDAQSRTINPVE